MNRPSGTAADEAVLQRRDFLKVGAGFSLALTLASVLPGCSDAGKAPAQGYVFLQPADVDLFRALAPVIVTDLTTLDGAERERRIGETLRNLDTTCAGIDLGGRAEVRKLLDLLAVAPLRYVLTGVGSWNEASAESLSAFLERWRGSRLAMLNAGGIILVKLVAASYYVIPATFASAGYPGPLATLYAAANT